MRTITIFGGSGFVGQSLVKEFVKEGNFIRVVARNPAKAPLLESLGPSGQITFMQGSILENISPAIQGADVVINLVGLLAEKGSQTFEALHVEGARRVAEKASALGVPTLLHMSALGADKNSRSLYASTKAKGEAAVLHHFPTATIFRPSVIFGPGDAFLNRFANMALISPILPLIGGGKTRFQPIYVRDVARCFLKASLISHRQTYELGGNTVYTFKRILEFLLKTIHRKRFLMPIPFGLAKGMATFAQFLPNSPLTPDQVELLKTDNVVSSSSLTIKDLGITPEALEKIAPLYLKKYCPKR